MEVIVDTFDQQLTDGGFTYPRRPRESQYAVSSRQWILPSEMIFFGKMGGQENINFHRPAKNLSGIYRTFGKEVRNRGCFSTFAVISIWSFKRPTRLAH